jgi:Toprim domain
MMQLTGLPGIATGGKGFLKEVEPPRCDEYIIAVDNDADGGSRQPAEQLARRLLAAYPGCKVRLALPEKPKDGKDGYDWNDVLMDCEAPGMEALHRDRILSALSFTPPPDHKQVIDKLTKVRDPIDLARKTKEAAKELGVCSGAVKEAVDQRRGELAKTPTAPPKPNIRKLAA